MAARKPDWPAILEDSEPLGAVMAGAIRMHELNATLGNVFQLHVIVDTNII